MNKAHKHAELIKAWADGAEIEYRSPRDEFWSAATTPCWDEATEYRIKPTEGTKEAPAVPEAVVEAKLFSAPVVIDTTKSWHSNLTEITVNGVQIEGVVRVDWNFDPGRFHELVLYIHGAVTKGDNK